MHPLTKVLEAAELFAQGHTTKQVSKQTGISVNTLSNWREKPNSQYSQFITKMIDKGKRVGYYLAESPTVKKEKVESKIVTDEMMLKHYNKFQTDDEIAHWLRISAESVVNWRCRDRLPQWVSAEDIGVVSLRNLTPTKANKAKHKMATYFFKEICREFPRDTKRFVVGGKNGGKVGSIYDTPPIGGVLEEIQRRMSEQRLSVPLSWMRRWFYSYFKIKRNQIKRGFYDLSLYKAIETLHTQHS